MKGTTAIYSTGELLTLSIKDQSQHNISTSWLGRPHCANSHNLVFFLKWESDSLLDYNFPQVPLAGHGATIQHYNPRGVRLLEGVVPYKTSELGSDLRESPSFSGICIRTASRTAAPLLQLQEPQIHTHLLMTRTTTTTQLSLYSLISGRSSENFCNV